MNTSRKKRSQWISILLVALLSGCAAGRYLSRGDQAMQARLPVPAREYYEKALAHKPKLANDPLFMEKLRVARRDAAVVEGNRLRSRKRWTEAIAKYEAALRYEPGFSPALAGIRESRADGRREAYEAAIQAADRQDAKAAREALARALLLLPRDELCLKARQSLDFPELGLSSSQLAMYRQAVGTEAAKKWHGAHENYERVIGGATWHLAARIGNARAKQRIEEADALVRRAQTALAKKEIPRTRQLLEQLKSLYPTHDRYRPLLGQVEAVEAQVRTLLSRASSLLSQRAFDESLQCYDQALQLYPGHAEARAGREDAERKAVDACFAEADRFLAQKEYGKAAACYNRVFTYRYRHHDAKQGLARISRQLFATYDRVEAPATALLWALHANSLIPGTVSEKTTEQLKRRIQDRHPLDMEMMVQSPAEYRSEAQELEESLDGDLIRMSGEKGYLITVSVSESFAETQVVLRENLNHPYDVAVEVENPEWFHLRDRLAAQKRCYEQSQREHERKRRIWLRYKEGMDAKNGIVVETVGGHTKEKPKSGKQARPPASGGYVLTPAEVARLKFLYKDQEQAARRMKEEKHKLEQIRNRFRHTSRLQTRLERHFWNYQRETTRRIVSIKVKVSILSHSGRSVGEMKSFESVQEAEDSMVFNPNIELGVLADPLELPSIRSMRQATIADLAGKIRGFYDAAIITHFLRTLQDQALDATDSETELGCRLAMWMVQQTYAKNAAEKTRQQLLNGIVYP